MSQNEPTSTDDETITRSRFLTAFVLGLILTALFSYGYDHLYGHGLGLRVLAVLCGLAALCAVTVAAIGLVGVLAPRRVTRFTNRPLS
jgi:hypothetical protein